MPHLLTRFLRKSFRVLTSSLLIVLISLTLLEILFRWGVPPSERFRIDQATRTGKSKFRVTLLGDSFSEDFDGTDQRFYLSQGLEFLNLAVFGTGPLDYLNRLRAKGLRYQPNLIIVNYFVGNDLTDTLVRDRIPFGERVIRRDSWDELGALSSVGSLFLLSVLYEFWFNHTLTRFQKNAKKEFASSPIFSLSHARNPFLVTAGKQLPDFFQLNLLVDDARATKAWSRNEQALEEMANLAVKMNSRLWINIYPATSQVNHSHDAFLKELGFKIPEDLTRTRVPQDLILAFCKRKRLDCFDLLPEFRTRGEHEFYQEYDDHWNSAGRELALRLVHFKLKAAGALPSAPASY